MLDRSELTGQAFHRPASEAVGIGVDAPCPCAETPKTLRPSPVPSCGARPFQLLEGHRGPRHLDPVDLLVARHTVANGERVQLGEVVVVDAVDVELLERPVPCCLVPPVVEEVGFVRAEAHDHGQTGAGTLVGQGEVNGPVVEHDSLSRSQRQRDPEAVSDGLLQTAEGEVAGVLGSHPVSDPVAARNESDSPVVLTSVADRVHEGTPDRERPMRPFVDDRGVLMRSEPAAGVGPLHDEGGTEEVVAVEHFFDPGKERLPELRSDRLLVVDGARLEVEVDADPWITGGRSQPPVDLLDLFDGRCVEEGDRDESGSVEPGLEPGVEERGPHPASRNAATSTVAVRSGAERTAVAPHPRGVTASSSGVTLAPMSEPGAVLTDPDLDRRLRRDGFVTFPLISETAAEALRAEFGRMRGWDGEGFQSDLVLDDPEYRREVQRVVGAAVDGPVGDHFRAHTPFLRSFLVKFPGGESNLYIHRDWMYVDEDLGHRTYAAWVALEDITGHNGQLRVLRGSHELDPMLRGTDLIAPWLRHSDVIDERFLSVPVRAGECVVFDNRLVHASFPNHTDTPRVAVAVGLKPVDVGLVHYRRIAADVAARFDVDEDFFCTVTPQGLLAAAPQMDPSEELVIRIEDMDAGDLARRLDRGLLARIDRVRHRANELGRRLLGRVRNLASAGPGTRSAAVHDRTEASPPSLLARVTRPGDAGIARAGRGSDPQASRLQRIRSWVSDLPTKAAIVVLGLNEAIIDRFGPATTAIWDPIRFDWSQRIEEGWPEIRSEVEALLEGPSEIPHIEDVTGGIPQGNIGPWRSFVLMHQGRWMDWNCDRCPRTAELVRSIPGLTMAGFSVLEPGTHITEHRGPNKGALRYQLGVIVPGVLGDCRIRVGEEMLLWREGEGVVFDFTVPHEAWNDSDAIRVLLMLEFLTPLPWYLAGLNRLAQHAMAWFPTTRDMTNRLRQLEPSLRRAS